MKRLAVVRTHTPADLSEEQAAEQLETLQKASRISRGTDASELYTWHDRIDLYGLKGVRPETSLYLTLSMQSAWTYEYDRKFMYRIFKRTLDLVLATVALVVLVPLLVFVSILIKIESQGPLFFKQWRAGLMGRPFLIWKFRTMDRLADKVTIPSQPMSKAEGVGRVTRVGRFLRKYKLDELPQLVNVIAGQMSLVGPRPLRLDESALVPKAYQIRFAVKPGLTGLWQALKDNSIRGTIKLKADAKYVRLRGMTLDLSLIFRTFWVVIRGEKLL